MRVKYSVRLIRGKYVFHRLQYMPYVCKSKGINNMKPELQLFDFRQGKAGYLHNKIKFAIRLLHQSRRFKFRLI